MAIRQRLKKGIKTVFLLLMLPIFILYRGVSLAGDPDSTFQSFSQALSLIPGKLGVYMRAAFYRLACPATSDNISIGFLTVLSHRDTTIESGVYIGPQCNIGKCFVGAKSLIGSGVHILSGNQQHNFDDPERPIQEQGGHFEKISIGPDCWLGNNSILMANLPEKSLVAAGTVVTRQFSAGDILVGNPARVLRNRLSPNKSNLSREKSQL
ncbi:acetyltransferase-like protein [Marinobacter santoriniensis NKSG1]|uniref:Acetyltransferase-like protein n=1 Tax=Marinobacter santoriniensis NKSG1 TaxID=1288826 RepID=M7CTR7_9GAMM|nr:acyltransferase [Marinobacter santoriniensis]EMP55570.1 acetyltransferase-like protein [Marinobacter santoriniensis NKSG1]